MDDRERIKQIMRGKLAKSFEILKDLPGDSCVRFL